MKSIQNHIKETIGVKAKILESKVLMNKILLVSKTCHEAYKNGNKVILAGNGGSAADSQHIAAEFVSKLRFDRPALSSIALSTDTSMLTAIGNDYGFENVFSRQLEANGKPGDIFIGISTSGRSKNVLKAFDICQNIGINAIALTGESAGYINKEEVTVINVPSDVTAYIQEAHIMIGHIICDFVEQSLFK